MLPSSLYLCRHKVLPFQGAPDPTRVLENGREETQSIIDH